MHTKKPMESVGWLGGSGYQFVVDADEKKAAEDRKRNPQNEPIQQRALDTTKAQASEVDFS